MSPNRRPGWSAIAARPPAIPDRAHCLSERWDSRVSGRARSLPPDWGVRVSPAPAWADLSAAGGPPSLAWAVDWERARGPAAPVLPALGRTARTAAAPAWAPAGPPWRRRD